MRARVSSASLRCLSGASSEVRVRFAPSPTGFLHLGGVRTALFNFLLARSSEGGRFLLRLEDTDRSRLVPGAAHELQKDLQWLGMAPDEGPTCGGGFGPYVQSQRLHLYREHTERLQEEGHAYPCFCPERRIELLRRDALRRREIPRYDNRCRHVPADEARVRARSEPHCIRLKLSAEPRPWHDLVLGIVKGANVGAEGDPVLLKRDGWPTYHLASVVDDSLMHVSHVLRGVEWVSSTPKHLCLYAALGLPPPRMAHLPLLLNSDGSKLSKRQGGVAVREIRAAGNWPLGVLNLVLSAGGGGMPTPHRGTPPRVFTLEEMARQFDLNRIGANSVCLEVSRLSEFNRLELQRRLSSGHLSDLTNEVKKMLLDHFGDKSLPTNVTQPEYISSVLLWSQERINRLSDLLHPELAFLWTKPTSDGLGKLTRSDAAALSMVAQNLRSMSSDCFKRDVLTPVLRKAASAAEVPFKELMAAMRLALSGMNSGPSVGEMMEILGKEETQERLESACNFLVKSTSQLESSPS